MSQDMTCGWDTGAALFPCRCGRPAKARTDVPSLYNDNGLVCGIHARKARRWHAKVTPLTDAEIRHPEHGGTR